jgi:hypothetical protein
MMLTDVYKIPIGVSLGVVAGILTVAIVASLAVTGREQRRSLESEGAETPRI